MWSNLHTLNIHLSFIPYLKHKSLEIQQMTQSFYIFLSISRILPPSFFIIWYKSILQSYLSYASSIWLHDMWPSHFSRHLLEGQWSVLLLIKITYTAALQIVTGLITLDLQTSQVAEFSLVTGLVPHLQIISHHYTFLIVQNSFWILLGKKFFQHLFKNFWVYELADTLAKEGAQRKSFYHPRSFFQHTI